MSKFPLPSERVTVISPEDDRYPVDLEKCPFCRKAPEITLLRYDLMCNGRAVIECDPCHVQMYEAFFTEAHDRHDFWRSMKTLMKRWNKRPTSTNQRPKGAQCT